MASAPRPIREIYHMLFCFIAPFLPTIALAFPLPDLFASYALLGASILGIATVLATYLISRYTASTNLLHQTIEPLALGLALSVSCGQVYGVYYGTPLTPLAWPFVFDCAQACVVCPVWNSKLIKTIRRPERIVQPSEVDWKAVIRGVIWVYIEVYVEDHSHGQAVSGVPLQAASASAAQAASAGAQVASSASQVTASVELSR
ncbi:hypothetical protein B0H13DRAFT_2327836 [Mycena leptocephala]|nr:hypothetical protein B0H13DRAFT_2327836 [Mycena leptocephala]